MGTHLQETLRSLCYKTEWKYAVFWKLKHRARMMLTWEDAYYDNHEPQSTSEDKCMNDTHENLQDKHYLRDPLGLAVAKMSYLVYSLGEGIIGHVAVSGKHQWIFADRPTCDSWSSSEYCDGWQTQFSAGIRTIAVIAVAPHGVVQLGSLNTVIEDQKLVTHTKNIFYSIHNSFVEVPPCPVLCNIKRNSFQGEELEKTSDSQLFDDYLQRLDKVKMMVEVLNNCVEFGSPTLKGDEGAMLAQLSSGIFNSQCTEQVKMELLNNIKHGKETIQWRNSYAGSRHTDALASNGSGVPSDFLDYAVWDRVVCQQKEGRYVPEPVGMQLEKDLGHNFGLQSIESHTSTVNHSLKFCDGSELHEALWPAFTKEQDSCALSEAYKREAGKLAGTMDGMESSLFVPECGSENLLEAVVASACHGSSNIKTEPLFSKSTESLAMTEELQHPFTQHIKHGCCSEGGTVTKSSLTEEDGFHFLNSTWGSTETCSMKFPKEISSTTLSTYSEQLDRRVERAKMNRKRAQPGESCRPRPRDRQLIQDRIKELRELVPNGSKLSIDVLLERTIKHMLFLESVTKHPNSKKKCDETELRDKGLGIFRSERGASWAVEVGSQAHVCPIIVENLNMNGKMLIEMLCEECSHFLEIAEAIRGLDLTIIKGVTKTRNGRTWACFVVEGQSTKSVHRMDILWSLMHLLQPKATI